VIPLRIYHYRAALFGAGTRVRVPSARGGWEAKLIPDRAHAAVGPRGEETRAAAETLNDARTGVLTGGDR
jgi:hypothetical protein